MKYLMLTLVFTLFLNLHAARAATSEEWSFQSKWDSFTLHKEGTVYSLDQKPVDAKALTEVRRLMTQATPYDCDKRPARPDLKITQKIGDREVVRTFYLKGKLMSDGEKCIEVTGQGIYYLPYHRQWFTGPKSLQLIFKNEFILKSPTSTLVELAEKDGHWVSADAGRFINWDLFFNMQAALKDFHVTGRAHADITKDLAFEKPRPTLMLTTRGRNYEFVNIKDKTWVVRLPGGTPWLILSESFGVLDEVNKASWDSPLASELMKLVNTKESQSVRIAIIDKVHNNSTRDVRRAFHQVLHNSEGDARVKIEVIKVLKRFPSDANMHALVKALNKTADFAVMSAITDALKVRNPKGPLITEEDDKPTTDQKIAAWKDWVKTLVASEE